MSRENPPKAGLPRVRARSQPAGCHQQGTESRLL
uniref:Uncharacterized protein n=1 Tax=Arundo donax TaxID=35708 RepID=A0A0A8ZHF3_ARUDO